MQTIGYNVGVDSAVWDTTQAIRVGIVMATGSNEFGTCVQGVIPLTRSTVSYEKSLNQGEVNVHDPSDYSDPANPITRDGVYEDGRATIKAGNMFGRAWASYRDVVVEAGADGLAVVRETSIFNDGADQPALDQINSKYGHLSTSKGVYPATAVEFAVGKWHLGFAMRSDSFSDDPKDSYLVLYRGGTNEPLFRIDGNGNVTHMNGRPVIVRKFGGLDVLTLG